MQIVNILTNEQRIELQYSEKQLLNDNLFASTAQTVRLNHKDYTNYVRIILLLFSDIKQMTVYFSDGVVECMVDDPTNTNIYFDLKPYYDNKDLLKIAKYYRSEQYDRININLLLNSRIMDELALLQYLPKLQYIYLFTIEDTYPTVFHLIENKFNLNLPMLDVLLTNKKPTIIFPHNIISAEKFKYAYIFMNHRVIIDATIITVMILAFITNLLSSNRDNTEYACKLLFMMFVKGYFIIDTQQFVTDLFDRLTEQYNKYIDLLPDLVIGKLLDDSVINGIFKDVSVGIPSILNFNYGKIISGDELVDNNDYIIRLNDPTQVYVAEIINYYKKSFVVVEEDKSDYETDDENDSDSDEETEHDYEISDEEINDPSKRYLKIIPRSYTESDISKNLVK